ncbi:putative Ig domain-containing protein [Lentisalinibacter orientalis]|uniref:putative Ig domain-containing protein n=1 Tax=Lentisalinibacter orientalis TaxID=2992241 RepID=UPI0038695D5E
MEIETVHRRTQAKGTISRTAAIVAAAMWLAACSSGGSDAPADGSGQTPPPSGGSSANNPPTISGNPPSSVKVDETYSFQPNASDPDGDTITFTVQNKPSWADFNTSSGALSGTPRSGDEGTYGNIRITASDGSDTDSLSFSVTVSQVATGSVTLSWTPPAENTDGSALTDLAGYKIYYGTSSGNYGNSVTIDNPGLTTYVVDNLSPNTYYFSATAFNSTGIESDFSGEAVKSVN